METNDLPQHVACGPAIGPAYRKPARLRTPLIPPIPRFVPLAMSLALGVATATLASCSRSEAPAAPPKPVVAAIRAEPRSFNRFAHADRSTGLIAQLVHARLVQLNHRTQEIEPALATRWAVSPDGRTYTLTLRDGVTFSDGVPFTADDVVFTFAALYDQKAEGPLTSGLKVNGQPIAVAKVDARTVTLTFAAPYGPGLRILNNLPIIPAHKLREALERGEFSTAWSTATPPADIVGLGPYTIRSYTPGERIELARNPRYGARGPGIQPGIERLTLRIIPSLDAERLALEAGELDILNADVRPDDIKAIRALEAAGKVKVHSLGPAVDEDALWFNLGPDARKPEAARPWLVGTVRRAVAHAVDRTAFINTVYLGAGVIADGPVPPGNRTWYADTLPRYAHDIPRARMLLKDAGLKDVNGDGVFETSAGKPLAIELLTQRGHAIRERGAAVIASDLAEAGLTVSVVPLDAPALVERLQKGTYDAAYFAVSASDTDPSANLDYWLSSGSFHVWHPRQKTPATPWEAEIDRLMHEMTALTDTGERRARFARVQQIIATELPTISFAAPSLVTATSTRLDGLEPAVIHPYLLWRADTMRLARPR
jgi:peptide/nickel transport system substrate-binding protein